MANSSSESPPSTHVAEGTSGEPRRNFLTSLLAIITGGIVGIVPAIAGGLFFLDPILRKRAGGAGGLLRAADLSELPTDGTPIRVVLRSDTTDAWTLYRNRVIGSIYLRLMPNGQILAFNDTCTHLGCKVDYQAADRQFFCPCHQSAFDLDGKPKNETPPRMLDDLVAEVKDGVVFVEYKNYRTGTPEKVATQ